MKHLIYLTVLASMITSSNAETILVPAGGDLIKAINQSSDGDVIQLEAGLYQPARTIDTIGRAITIRGVVDDAAVPVSIIDGQGSIPIFRCASGEGTDTVFENLLLTGGQGDLGGAMYCFESSPVLTNCIFEQNSSYIFGGGIYCLNSNLVLTNCVFRQNSTSINGGGIYCFDSNPILTDCVFQENSSAIFGGGVYCANTSSPTFTGTILCGNTPDQFSGPFTDAGGNCIQELCIDCEPDDCVADITGNGVIDGEDLGLMFAQWGACGVDCTADLTGDGQVDGGDLGVLLGVWGLCQ